MVISLKRCIPSPYPTRQNSSLCTTQFSQKQKPFMALNAHSSNLFKTSSSATSLSVKNLKSMATILNQQHSLAAFDDSRLPVSTEPEIPIIDLHEFFTGDPNATVATSRLVADAFERYGVFQVVNHGVEGRVVGQAQRCLDSFFEMELMEKQKAKRKVGESFGYTSSFTGKFSSDLLWRETLSVPYSSGDDGAEVKDYFVNVMGEDFRHFGVVYDEYCKAMCGLSLVIMELLGLGLGVGPRTFRDFFEKNDSILRLNCYPPCPHPDLNLGIHAHYDPISLTILHQDEVGGLQVFVDNKWRSVNPIPNAFVVSVGDTLMALCNGRLKSCLHRALVNTEKARKSMAFFFSPEKENVVSPPRELVDVDHPRKYHDFKWSMLLEFTQKHYTADTKTLDAFSAWLHQNQTTSASVQDNPTPDE